MFRKHKNQYLVFDLKRLEFTVRSNKIKKTLNITSIKKSPNIE